MLKSASLIKQATCGFVLLGAIAGCTPLPSSSSLGQESPRPVKPLPAETLIRSAGTPSYRLSPNPTGAKSSPTKVKLSAAEMASQLQQAEDKAISAENLAQSAQSKEDWNLVINQWNRAIALLPPLSSAGAQKANVQQKRADYQSKLANAQQKAKTNPRQLVTGGSQPIGKGIPLIIAPDSPDPKTASPSPTASPASPSLSASPPSKN
ncbi:hypothetical protein C7B65_06380 [Phormidesmis priestleyi ULC007]|uniref:Uncharacterized protein n=1 Tax=Phormidesmis priestleyi ULC007 TaxID=1920490 RepID=A0A2T1DJ42_9CYAN|nr:hypothetical protein [Phormidesmis priestleyi]PSB20529.1 hypothetical protein C7B65_06380 [Phormidesmis priestleyi ULC007]PZO54199.1 MAG: hypothetical protein DCF14_02025 [Phormidesmis priestleyi]